MALRFRALRDGGSWFVSQEKVRSSGRCPFRKLALEICYVRNLRGETFRLHEVELLVAPLVMSAHARP